MSAGTKSKKTDELLKNLFNTDETIALAALSEVREAGNATLIAPLISLYATSENEQIHKEAADLLSTIKVSNAELHFIEALTDSSMQHIRKDLISFIWSSGIQPVNHIARISEIAIEGSFEEALESITLLDSLETAIPEDVLLESITLVKQHLTQAKKDDKTALLHQYLLALENQRVED